MKVNKHIEEMARTICSRPYRTCEACVKESEKVLGKTDIDDCECYLYAKRFYNVGYRKEKDTAEEFGKFILGLFPSDRSYAIISKSTIKEKLKEYGVEVDKFEEG